MGNGCCIAGRRFVSTVHAVIAVWAVYRVMFVDPYYRNPKGEFTFETTSEGMLAAAITLSYWYYDLILCLLKFVCSRLLLR